jgi:MoaA/NifB/PqqE/SkfB family radical SAM enzyme
MLNLDGCKLIHHLDRLNDWKQGKRIAPITMDIALTRACNYKCTYCYSQLQGNKSKPMTWEAIKRFLEDAKEIGVKAISLVSDGESTCHKDFVKTIQYGHSIGLDMALGTNGSLLSLNSLGAILPCLTYIRFNFSGSNPETYAKWHGVSEVFFYKAIENIIESVRLKKNFNLPVTIGLQMVFLPEMEKDIIPLARFGKRIGVDYLVIKHCSDDESHTLGIHYADYLLRSIRKKLRTAELMSNDKYQVAIKWSKLFSHGQRCYSKCYASQFIMQLSGSGLVAPCGMLFNEKYKKYHIGNIVDTSFKELFYSNRYKEVMDELASDRFDAKTMCGSLCLQHKCNEFLNSLMEIPAHVNFI